MLAKKIKYTDYNGNEREETFYFNLKSSELMDLELSEQGGILQTLNKIVETKDGPKLLEYFKKIILGSYGEKSPDGRRFIKSPELSKAFEETEAYSELVMSFYRDPKTAADFVNAIMPATIQEKASEIGKDNVTEFVNK